MRMIDQLVHLATIWADANSRSRSRLATLVVNDGKFFDKIEMQGAGCTVATFEKFLLFFRDGANWPDGRIPEAACDLLDNFSNIALTSSAHPGETGLCAGEEADTPLPDGENAACSSMPPRSGDAGAEGPACLSAPEERTGDLAA